MGTGLRSLAARTSGLMLALGLGFARAAIGAEGEPPAPAPVPLDVGAPEGGQAGGVEDPLTVYVMTMGPGSHPFFKFGHNAIWIHDRATATDRVYNFGTFRFDSPRLILDFLGGRLTYWLSVAPLSRVLAEYQHENRTISVQELALSPEVERSLQARLEENARPENRAYKYDYFLDNCSTRVRDLVDAFVDGRLHASARSPARLTLRGQALRLTADHLPLYVALAIVLGPDVDRPIDRWGEMFIPEELARGFAVVKVRGEKPLVASEKAVFHASRKPPLQSPPDRRIPFLLAGVGIGLVFLTLGWLAPGFSFFRALLGALTALWGFATGFVGCFLVYAWALTDHVVAHRNQNILLCAPWAIALSVLGVGVAIGRRGATAKAAWVAILALVAALIACVLKLGLVRAQENGMFLALFVPAWVGLSAALWRLKAS